MSVIEVREVTKRYGKVTALQGVSFSVERGEIVALLGRNGAGKTTAIEIMLGLRNADSGRVLICGENPRHESARAHVGATPQDTGFPDALRVRELLEFAAAHYPHPRDSHEVLAAFDLEPLVSKRVGDLTGGQQRRVALALALIGNADMVILDEPSGGLDVESRLRLWTQLEDLARARTVLFTTHYLEEAEALATRILVIDAGRMQFDGTPEAFRRRFGVRRVEYVGDPLAPAAESCGIERIGDRTVVTTSDTDAYVRALVRAEQPFSDLRVTQSSFEEMFLDLTGGVK